MTLQEPVALSDLIKTPEQKYFLQVLSQYTIRDYSTKNIKDSKLGHEGRKLALYHIGNALSYVFKLIGIKDENWPDKEKAGLIADIIEKTFGYITPDEVYTAFEFAIQDRFEVPRDKGLNHYQSVDAIYITDVLKAYVQYAHPKKENVKLLQSQAQREANQLQLLRDFRKRNHEAMIRMIEAAYDELNDTGAIKDTRILQPAAYDLLIDLGILEADEAHFNTMFVTVARYLNDGRFREVDIRTKQELIIERMRALKGADIFAEYRSNVIELASNNKLTFCYLSDRL